MSLPAQRIFRRLAWTMILALLLPVFALGLLDFWEWSMMDDLGLKTGLLLQTQTHGYLKGIGINLERAYSADQSWGLFRPAYWLYISTFYLVEPSIAYALRTVMFLIVILIPTGLFYKKLSATSFSLEPKSTSAAQAALTVLVTPALLANRSLYDGLSFISLQELSGLLSWTVGAWLWLGSAPTEHGRRIGGSSLFLVAALFKAPFIWFSLLFAMTHFPIGFRHSGSTKDRIWWPAYLILVLVSLGCIVYWAKTGGYTSSVVHFDLRRAITAATGFMKQALIPLFILLAASVAFEFRLILGRGFWARLLKTSTSPGLPSLQKSEESSQKFSGSSALEYMNEIAWERFAVLCGLSGLLYTGNLLPWGAATGYYYGPSVYLITFGCLGLAVSRVRNFRGRPERAKAVLVCSILLASLVLWHGVNRLVRRNATVSQVRNWMLTLPASPPLEIATNGLESADRLQQLMRLRLGVAWRHTVVPSGKATSPNYWVALDDQGPWPVTPDYQVHLELPAGQVLKAKSQKD